MTEFNFWLNGLLCLLCSLTGSAIITFLACAHCEECDSMWLSGSSVPLIKSAAAPRSRTSSLVKPRINVAQYNTFWCPVKARFSTYEIQFYLHQDTEI